MRSILVKLAVVVTIVGLVALWGVAWGVGRGGAAGFAAPFLHTWHWIETGVTGAVSGLVPWLHGPGERARDLEARLRLTEIRLAETDELRRQNVELRELAGLPSMPRWRIVIAEVIARDPVTWNREFQIGRGRADGLVPGAAVLAGTCVIGRISDCAEHTATVTTVASQACRLSVVLSGSLQTGILSGIGTQKWRQRPACVVDFLPPETEAAAGDMVWTSGLGGTVPSGLAVGRVAAGKGSPVVEVVDGAHARVPVAPGAAFGRVRFVAVVCPAEVAAP